MKYTPNEGRILVKKLNQKDYVKTNEGIFVAGQGVMNKDLTRGVVLVGNDEIKQGQKIWYSDYSATVFYDEDLGAFICLADEDVMVFEGEDNEEDKALIKRLTNDTKEVSKPAPTDKPKIIT